MAASPILSELRIFSSGIVPKGWAACNGQLLPINQNQALFALLGTTFGGNGVSNFALPDLAGRVPMHRGTNFNVNLTLNPGDKGGEQTHTLSIAEIPNHTHAAVASRFEGNSTTPENNFWAANIAHKPYGSMNNNDPMSSAALSQVGGDSPHNNMAPFLVLNICIATVGIFPSPDNTDVTGDPWITEIRILACRTIPNFYVPCDGQKLPISKNADMFGLIGTTYGGDGSSNFGMPNLQASAPVMAGQGSGLSPYLLGETGGEAIVTLTGNEIPQHTHAANAKESGSEGEPERRIWANPGSQDPLPKFFSTSVETDPQRMNPAAIESIGGGSAHNNLMPFNTLTYCIAIWGTEPPR